MQHKSSPTLRTMVEVATALGCEVTPGVVPCGFRPKDDPELHLSVEITDYHGWEQR